MTSRSVRNRFNVPAALVALALILPSSVVLVSIRVQAAVTNHFCLRDTMTDTHALTPVDHTIPVFARWFGSWQISVQRRALSVPELTRRYDESATDWHRAVDRLGFPAAYESLLRQFAGSEMPSTVLDCGVGTGALSQALIRVLPAPFALTAVDVSPGMLEQAQNVLRGTNANVTLRQANAAALPYDNNTFDMGIFRYLETKV